MTVNLWFWFQAQNNQVRFKLYQVTLGLKFKQCNFQEWMGINTSFCKVSKKLLVLATSFSFRGPFNQYSNHDDLNSYQDMHHQERQQPFQVSWSRLFQHICYSDLVMWSEFHETNCGGHFLFQFWVFVLCLYFNPDCKSAFWWHKKVLFLKIAVAANLNWKGWR